MNCVYVAQLDGDKVVGVSMLSKNGFKQTEQQVLIHSLDESLIGKNYDAKSGTFKEA